MKIGLLTFHWATNYGAVLQCYVLQTYLESLGHEVMVINYKPLQYEESFYKFVRYRKFLRFKEYIDVQRKEDALASFRINSLKLTRLVRTCSCIKEIASQFDVIISGSDQVVNPFFLCNGEAPHTITPTYFLGFPYDGKRIGYALSFGCTKYPEDAKQIAIPFIKKFNSISVREATGIDIIRSMGRDDVTIVPDPTILMEATFYQSLAESFKKKQANSYVYCFFIRNISDIKSSIKSFLSHQSVLWNNDDGDYTIQGWLSKIMHAEVVLTDSFHCVVMCLKFHKQFIVVTMKDGNVGMNDRLYTLLSPLDLDDRIINKAKLNKNSIGLVKEVDWTIIDNKLTYYSQAGKSFLDSI